ncbi:MAG: M28 family peptidase [Proteobacteria bacterium]|nr:M28 family peptidase [Pseudomonadota bacterium]
MPMRILPVVLVACLLAACGQSTPPESATATATAPAPKPAPVKPTTDGHFSPEITAADFAGYDMRLASDEFEGRKPGTIGERMTTTYLIDQFKSMGLKPGNSDSYLQSVPAVETTLLDGGNVALDVAEGGKVDKYTYRNDLIVGTLQGVPDVAVKDADMVFAGYGIVAPEYHWNDYAGLDVKGKIVIVLVNDPGHADASLFKGKNMTYYGRWTYKYEEAARQGAAGCLIVHETGAAGYPWEVVVNSWSGPQFSLVPDANTPPRLAVAGWLTGAAAQRLLAGAGADLAALEKAAVTPGFTPVPLKATASIAFHNQIRNMQTDNVLALMPGTTRKDEAIVYTAHWDHFGRDPTLKGDQIYNGAVDNGTGLSALLEIADAFAHQNPPPQRSVLFLATTLEEAGLLGSQYYTLHPVFPLAKTVADINMDELIPWGRAHDMSQIGYGQSQMDQYLADALKAQGRVVSPDEEPEKGFFFRSDQLNFARHGVPVLYAQSGFDKLDGGNAAGHAAYADFTTNRYHKPADNYDPNWDLSGVIEDVKALYAVGKTLANESTFPQWSANSEFRAAREASLKAADKH